MMKVHLQEILYDNGRFFKQPGQSMMIATDLINAQLIPIGTLSQARGNGSGIGNNKILLPAVMYIMTF
jgi:hypothetical protein